MTYEEFKAKVEELGYFTDTNYFNIRIFDKYKETIAYLRRAVGDIDKFYESFSKLEKSKKIEILDICYELAKTPLEKRISPKRYYLKHKFLDNYGKYLGLYKTLGVYHFTGKTEGVYDEYQVKFTLAEIEEIKETYQVSLEDWELVEVE